MKELTASLQEHYSHGPTCRTILENLQRKGVDPAKARPEDLYPYDQTHAGGIATTRKLAQRAGIQARSSVVDVGCGIGGAARYLNAEFSCRVFGIDLALARLRTAVELNRLLGLEERIHILAAEASSLPLPSHVADVVWTQHLTMNLPDLTGFLQECGRVLKPSGGIALHEWFLQRPGTLRFPLPWASNSSLNHAVPSGEFLQMLRDHNFVPETEDVTAPMQDALRKDARSLSSRNTAAERVAELENLLQAASQGLLCCLMITARKKRSQE